jgi:hypothetical protein
VTVVIADGDHERYVTERRERGAVVVVQPCR